MNSRRIGLYGHETLRKMRDNAVQALTKKGVSVDIIRHNQELFYDMATSLKGLDIAHAKVDPQKLLYLALYHENFRSSSSLPPEVRVIIGALMEEFLELKRLDMSHKEVWTPYSRLVGDNPTLAIFRMLDLAHMPLDKEWLVKHLRFSEKNADEQLCNTAEAMLYVYTPIADMLGLSNVMSTLRNNSVMVLYPELYYEVSRRLAIAQEHYEMVKRSFAEQLTNDINEASSLYGVEFAPFSTVDSIFRCRIKTAGAIVQKLRANDMSPEEMFKLHDIVAFTVLTSSVEGAFMFMEFLREKYNIPNEDISDYITSPKGKTKYQSLHIDVPCIALEEPSFAIEIGNKKVEIQVRTPEMQIRCERGDWAHALYKPSKLEKEMLLLISDYIGVLKNASSEDVQAMALSIRSPSFPIKVIFNNRVMEVDLPNNACGFDLICKVASNPLRKHVIVSAKTGTALSIFHTVPQDGEFVIGTTNEQFSQKSLQSVLPMCSVETRMLIENLRRSQKKK